MAANRQAKEKAIIACLRKGGTRRSAYRLASVSGPTFYRWMNDDEAFCNSVTRAEAEAELECVNLIQKAAVEDWRAAAWMQEHHPQRKDEWKSAKEMTVRDLTNEQIAFLLRESEGGGDSPGDRLATAGAEGAGE